MVMLFRKKQIDKAEEKCDSDYEDYEKQREEANKNYDIYRNAYNAEIGLINSERIGLRDEIRELYHFLISINGCLESRITIFDFATEPLAEAKGNEGIQQLRKPSIKKKSDLCQYIKDIEKQKMEYEKQLKEYEVQIDFLRDAVKIAETYRNIIIIVKDTIKNKILPELDLISAFLYADAIRQIIVEDGDLDTVTPCSITEYEGTRQDCHYQFVNNTFDFYNICTHFFEDTVLTDILKNGVVSEEDKNSFSAGVEEIKNKISFLDSKRMVQI